jgi:hypothetical protein
MDSALADFSLGWLWLEPAGTALGDAPLRFAALICAERPPHTHATECDISNLL